MFSAFIDLDPGTGRAAVAGMPDYAGNGWIRVRGSSSALFYPKKQYSFETWGDEDKDLSVSLFGMPTVSDWVLSAPYADKTLMRNHLAYRCFEDFGHYCVRTRFFELFSNTDGGAIEMADYHGIYLLVERIKRDAERVDINALEATDVTGPDISGGYIIKPDRPEPDDTTFRTAAENTLLIFSEPEVPTAEQIDYLRNYMNTFETALHGAGSPIRPVGMRSTSMLARGSISIC